MDLATALEYVRLQSDADGDPAVSDDEILNLLNANRLADKYGNAPGSADWAESYWLPRVVAEVFALKVTRAAKWVDTTTDGTSIAASQAVESLRRLEGRWRRRCVAGL